MALPDRLRLPLTRRFQTTLATLVARGTAPIQRAWDDLDNYDEDAVATLTKAAATPLGTVKAATVRQSSGYYSVLSGRTAPPIALAEVAVVAALRSPFISTWQALASGNSFEAAKAAGRSRIEAVVADYTVSTSRQTGGVFVAKTNLRTVGWERIPNADACPWCEEVSGQLYSSSDAADFGHDRCACSAAPVFANE